MSRVGIIGHGGMGLASMAAIARSNGFKKELLEAIAATESASEAQKQHTNRILEIRTKLSSAIASLSKVKFKAFMAKFDKIDFGPVKDVTVRYQGTFPKYKSNPAGYVFLLGQDSLNEFKRSYDCRVLRSSLNMAGMKVERVDGWTWSRAAFIAAMIQYFMVLANHVPLSLANSEKFNSDELFRIESKAIDIICEAIRNIR